ncbi:MAG: peptidoglycan DD-metalloendopeptidase family protein [Thermotogae bacterium]|nr:peptidoglycan DD-metalloendopeptidase family protein [Thermotogota bacterium]
MKKFLEAAGRSYAALFFNSSLPFGFLLLAITFLNPNMGMGGAVSVASAYLFARAVGFRGDFLRLDYYIYNPLLVGLALGYMFKVNPLSVVFFALAGILTFLLTYTLSVIFYRYFGLPVLSLPFVLTSALLYLASTRFTNLFVISLYPRFHLDVPTPLPVPVEGFFKSLGAIVFTPTVLAGVIVFLAILGVSRILALLGVVGYVVGVLTHALLVGSIYQAVIDISAFNYILIAMAVGGVFLIPSIRSYAFAILAVAVAVPVVEGIKVFWEAYGVPAFAFPFNLTVLLLLYVLLLAGYPFITRWYRGTPERTLDGYLTYVRRFPYTGREISLPFSGGWTVWQAFDDEWTHRGPWKYAYDFVITDSEGRTYRNDGYYLTDYYAFGKPVLSPVEGTVVAVQNDLPDNPPGQADKENNWGNHVLIYDRRGFYVLLSHFKQKSIRVKVGDYVQRGSLLGQCGNSGYSPQPHIHVHVQADHRLGSPTLPFAFISYEEAGTFHDVGRPAKGARVEPVFPDRGMHRRLNLLIDQEMDFVVRAGGREHRFHTVVKMDSSSYFYLTDGRARLYFGINNSAFYFYSLMGDPNSPLRYFLFAVPKVPLLQKMGMRWRDHVPLQAVSSSLLREAYLFLSSFKHDLFAAKVVLRWSGPDRIEGLVSLPRREVEVGAKLAPDFGFEEVRYADVVIRRVRDQGLAKG